MRWIVIALMMWPAAAAATRYTVDVVRVLDGDTVDVDVQIWPGLRQRIRVRVAGVDTPEIHTRRPCEKQAGYEAKRFVEAWVQSGGVMLDQVTLGKYAGRVVGHLRRGGRDLSADLLAAGLAQPYDGGHKTPWVCRQAP